MVLRLRRYVLVAFVLTFFVFLRQLHNQQSPGSAQLPHYGATTASSSGRWSWADRKRQYPVDVITSLPTGRPQKLPAVQHSFGSETAEDRTVRLQRRQVVKDAFTRCWKAYHARAWMKDELTPISGKGRNSFGGWSATLVDALDTLWIMDMRSEFNQAVAAAVHIDFSTSTDEEVNVFETTIRYLGGFIAAYDLSGDARLLRKAVEVGEMLLIPFDTPNHMPVARWNWTRAAAGESQHASSRTIVSELGSLTLEFTRLSQLTGDSRWYDAVDRITRLFEAQQQQTHLPGMWPTVVDAENSDLTGDSTFTWGGMSDSLYEYFPKTHALLGGLEPIYQTLYDRSMATALKYLLFKPMTPSEADVLVAGDVITFGYGGPIDFTPVAQHLTCFAGGMLALGGKLFAQNDHVSLARKLTDGCIWAYNATTVGVMPETALLVPCPSQQSSCPWNEKTWRTAVLGYGPADVSDEELDQLIANENIPRGYSQIMDPRYILRPEALESVFITYRVTGDRKYPDAAWDMFNAIQRITQTSIANAAVSDITATTTGGLPPKSDRMESFWLAETLKYAYLIFSEPSLINLDEFVLNTEAHPFRRPSRD